MRFGVLGALEIQVAGTALPVRGPREQKILATLMLEADRLVSIDRLVEAVWDDRPPTTAPTQIRNRVSELRRAWAGALGRPEDVLVTQGNGYLLRLGGHDFDLAHFDRDVVQAQTAARTSDIATAATRLRDALGHWRGQALAGVGGRVLTAAAARLEERRLTVTEECLGYELALGAHHELVAELTALAEAHPFRERLIGHLMLALYRSDRQADALNWYARCAQRLRDELGLDPGDPLRTLHQAILRRAPELAAVPAPAPVPLAGPEPDPVGVPDRPAELPADLVDFTGRAEELRQLDAILAGAGSTGVPIVAISGTAGVGKTALAVHWAHRVAARFPDGQVLVNLQGYGQGPPTRPVDALASMLRSVGVPNEHVPADLEEASRLFRSVLAGKRMLLVLDNAISAEQVRPLLPGSARSLVLVTSRDRLVGLVASNGARRVTVEPLGAGDATDLLTRILGPERLRKEPDAVAGLIGATASLPLALRIAAANLDAQPHRSIAEYADELSEGDRLAALRIEGDSAVQAVFDDSYAALPADTQRVFRLLGLAPGPDIALAAVPALAGIDPRDATRHVDRLAAAHLVQYVRPGRCTSHDLLRLYARQRAEREEPRQARHEAVGTLLTWYLDHARAAARVLHPHMLRLSDVDGEPGARFADSAEALAWLDPERANLVAAVRFAAGDSHQREAWLLADALRGYFWLRADIVDWLDTATEAVNAAVAAADPRGEAAARLTLGFAHYSQGRYQESLAQYRTMLELSRRAGWAEGQASALGNIGLACANVGELQEAMTCLESAAAIDRRLGRRLGLATSLCTLGQVYTRRGDLEAARRHLREALTLYQATGSVSGQAMAEGGLAHVLRLLGRAAEAERHCRRTLEVYHRTGDQDGEASALALLAHICHDNGEPQTALAYATQALEMIENGARQRRVATALNALGRVQLALGNARAACVHHERAIGTAKPDELRFDIVDAYAGMAAALHRLGLPEAAERRARQALELARRAGFRLVATEAMATLAAIRAAERDARDRRPIDVTPPA